MGTPCNASRAVLDEASRRWPARSRLSDGLCASPSHSATNPTSDHEPDSRGICHAADLTKDVEAGVDTHELWNGLAARRDRRVKYLIRDGQIWNPSIALYWRAYYGANDHSKHGHVSILTVFENDVADWFGENGGGLMAGDADRIIATIGQYEQDTRRLLVELLERQGKAIRAKQQRTTTRIIEAIERNAPAAELAKAALDDDGPGPEDVAAEYLREIEELGKALDEELDAADGRGELVTRADVDAAVARFREGLADLKG